MKQVIFDVKDQKTIHVESLNLKANGSGVLAYTTDTTVMVFFSNGKDSFFVNLLNQNYFIIMPEILWHYEAIQYIRGHFDDSMKFYIFDSMEEVLAFTIQFKRKLVRNS